MGEVADKIRNLLSDIVRDKKSLIRIMSVAVILMLALILRIHNSGDSDIRVEAAAEAPESEELYIDVGGAVQRPGVYKVENGTRLYEVIELAGGLRSDADTNSVNQAAFVEDGAKIVIPVSNPAGYGAEGYTGESYPAAADMNTSSLININTADKESLKSLSGIGDVIAERIIEYRSMNRFQQKEDIIQVKGIGSSIYEKIKDEITV